MPGLFKWAREKANSVYQGVVGTLEAIGTVAYAAVIFVTTPDLQRNVASRLFEFTLGAWRVISPFNYLDLVRRPQTRQILWQGIKGPLRRLSMAVGYYSLVRPGLRRLVNTVVTQDPIMTELVMAVPEAISIVYFTNRGVIDGRVDGICYNLAMAKASSDEVLQEVFKDLKPLKKVIPEEYKNLTHQQLVEKLLRDPKKFEAEYGLSQAHQTQLANPMIGPCPCDEDTRGSATIPSAIHYIGTAVFVNVLGAAARGYSPYGSYAAILVNALFIGRGNLEYAVSASCMQHRLDVLNRNNTYALGSGGGVMALGYGVEYSVEYGVRYALEAVIRTGFKMAYGADIKPEILDDVLKDVSLAGRYFVREPIDAALNLHGIMVTNLNRAEELPGKGRGVDLFKPCRALTDTVQGQLSEWMSSAPSSVDWRDVLHSKPARAAAWMFIQPDLQVWHKPVIANGVIVRRDGWEQIAMRKSSRMFLKFYADGVVVGLKGAREKSRYIPYKAFNYLNRVSPAVAGLFASEDDRAKLAMINQREVKDTMDVWTAYLEKISSQEFMQEGESPLEDLNNLPELPHDQSKVYRQPSIANDLKRQMSLLPPPRPQQAGEGLLVKDVKNESHDKEAQPQQPSTVVRKRAVKNFNLYAPGNDERRIPDLGRGGGLRDALLGQMSATDGLKK